ncbi:hypothetical protein C3L33_03976, partial [Rhododendron williamsianum]
MASHPPPESSSVNLLHPRKEVNDFVVGLFVSIVAKIMLQGHNRANKGLLSEQLVLMKVESMTVLKDFITKHNVPNEVPDETDDLSSEDDETNEKATVKSKKQRK